MNHTIDLKNTPFATIKRIALEQAQDAHIIKHHKRLTLDMLHIQTGIPMSTMSRYFSDPHYQPSPETIPVLCRAMDNYLMIDWQAAQCGGIFLQRSFSTTAKKEQLTRSVDRIQRGASEMLTAMLEAVKDGQLTTEEVLGLITHFRNVAKTAEESLIAAEEGIKR